MLVGFFLTIFIPVIMVLADAFHALDLIHYLPLIPFIYPFVIKMVIDMYVDEIGQIIYGANRATYMMVTNIISNLLNLGFFVLILKVFQIQSIGLNGIIFIMIWAGSMVNYLFVFIGAYYIQKTIIKLRVNVWPTLGAPLLSLGIVLLINIILKRLIYDQILQSNGFFFASIPAIIIIFFMGAFVYFPLTAVLGGWDEGNYRDFRKCVKMSGPSKFLVAPIFKVVKFFGKKSPLYNRFKYNRTEAEEEAVELMEMKQRGEFELKS